MKYGLQMYSVRDLTEHDLRGALQQVAEMGYSFVEFAGFMGNSAEDVKNWLEEYGLQVSSTHTPLAELEDEVLDQTIAYHKVIGCKDIIIPYAKLETKEQIDAFVERVNTLIPKLQAEGISLHYHNHDCDFAPTPEGLVPEEELKSRVAELGDALYERFAGKNPLFLGVLKGSFVFMADLVRACQLKSDVEFIAVSSYENATVSSGRVQITHDLQQDITGRHLIIVEDILDSGNTLAFLRDYLMTKGAASITIVTLLDKPSRRTKAINADLAGFVVPDEFVVGYGLDYCQQYRNVPYIGVLKPEVYSGK